MSKKELFEMLVSQLAPTILAVVPKGDKIAPFVPMIIHGVKEAEAIPGATGDQKKAYVLDLAQLAATTLTATGKLHLDPQEISDVASHGIDAVIGAVKAVQKAHTGILLPPANPTGTV